MHMYTLGIMKIITILHLNRVDSIILCYSQKYSPLNCYSGITKLH